MADIGNYGFEGASGASDNWTSSQGVIDTTQFVEGAQSIYFDCTGTSKQNQLTLPGSTRVITGRFYYRVKADVSASASIIQADHATSTMFMQGRVGRKLRVGIVGGTNSADTAALNIDQWYRIDFMFRSDTGTASIAYKIDGVDQTGITKVVAAGDMSTFRLGNTLTNTYQAYFDALKLTDQVADYPLGALPVVAGDFPYVGGGYYPG